MKGKYMTKAKIRDLWMRARFYIICALILLACFTLQLVTRRNSAIADFLTFGPSAYMRAALAGLSSLFPFSIGETIILMIPVLTLFILYLSFKPREPSTKIIKILITILTVMYSLFALSFAPAYGTTTADILFGTEDTLASTDELYEASLILTDEINALADQIKFDYKSFSRIDSDLVTLSEKLVRAYDTLADRYSFIVNFNSRMKPIALSRAMTYTHISGVYTYYTGEANVNTNFPDYTLPFTCAHEMAHQRGFAREKEANFVAFLVCLSSDDPYINYSGRLNMLEYIMNALYISEPELYFDIFYKLDIRVRCELAAYSSFFDTYRDSNASEISGAINDTYLKSQGQTEGKRSYALVVDLAVSYILSKTNF